MQRKYVKKNVSAYNTGRSTVNQELVYQHMSNHYRRILNAKKVVDTSPPYCFKQKRTGSSHIVPVLPTARSFKTKLSGLGRNISPAATERSISTNSCSCTGPYPSSRYHASCVEETSNPSNSKKCLFDKRLIDQIAFDTKNGPSTYCQHDRRCCKTNQTTGECKIQEKKNKSESIPSRNPKRRLQNKENQSELKRIYSLHEKPPPTDISVRDNNFFISSSKHFAPAILKTNAVSKLRSLRVYYPPRKRGSRLENKSSPELPIECSPEVPDCKCRKLCVCDSNEEALELKKNTIPKEQSQTSSRDSAYNGGVSSLSGSRSPTPDHRIKKECSCIARREDEQRIYHQSEEVEEQRAIEKTSEVRLKNGQDVQSVISGSSRSETPRESNKNFTVVPKTKNAEQEQVNALRRMKQDAQYIKFVQDITVEILDKCLYTNKALKKIMKKHILKNLDTLEKDRMLKEVDHLRIQLGVPEDKTLFDLDPVACDSLSDVPVPYPVISDSEFVMPGDNHEEPERSNAKTCRKKKEVHLDEDKNCTKSPSSESENEELVSVIQVAQVDVRHTKMKGTTTSRPSSGTPTPYKNPDKSSEDESSDSSEETKENRARLRMGTERKSSESSLEISEKISLDGDVSMESGNDDEKPEVAEKTKERSVRFRNHKESFRKTTGKPSNSY